MYPNQIGLLILAAYSLLAITSIVLISDKLKFNFWINFVLVVFMILLSIYGFGILIDLLIHDT